jgi:hypothetical protein
MAELAVHRDSRMLVRAKELAPSESRATSPLVSERDVLRLPEGIVGRTSRRLA